MVRVCRLAAVTMETPDLPRSVAHYSSVMGLAQTSVSAAEAYLGVDRERHSLNLMRGSRPVCTKLSFQIAVDADLAELSRQIEALGVRTERVTDPEPSISSALRFLDPKGTIIQIHGSPGPSGNRAAGTGIAPVKLGHIAFNVVDRDTLAKTHGFYSEGLGFRVSDWISDFFVFMRCNPDHHTCNFLLGSGNKMHHLAFELRDWAHMQNAADLLAQRDIELIWGPGRHGPGHNIFLYYRDPDGNIIELFCELDRILDEDLGWFDARPWHKDYPQKPKVWEDSPKAVNIWGPPPPEGFL